MSPLLFLPIGVFLAALALTALALAYARRRRLMDTPGSRSSHERPTPRGGGVGIWLVLLGTILLLWHWRLLPGHWTLGLGGGLLLVGAVGWADDHRSLDFRLRFAAQAVAAAWLVFIAGGLERLELGPWAIAFGPLDDVIAFVGVIWLTNLYNFMDGIDSLAAAEGIFAGLVLSLWLWPAGAAGLSLLALSLAAACGGFLPFNLPKARLFMGDVGSTAIGFTLAAIVLFAAQSDAMPALVGLVVLSVFILDATFTLVSRMMRRERWYTAHREHAYQYLVRAGMGHGRATMILMAVNVLVILPMVMVMHRMPVTVAPGTALIMVLLWCAWSLARRHGASVESRERS